MIIFLGFVIGFAVVELNLTANGGDDFWMDYAERRYDMGERMLIDLNPMYMQY